jgi:hypothetical protein
MSYNDALASRTSSPSLSERVRSFTTLRSRISSASRTVSADDIETETEAGDESDNGSAPPDRVRSDPGAYSGEQLFQYFDASRSLNDRINAIQQIIANVNLYALPILINVCRDIRDLTKEESPMDARKACFSLLHVISSRTDLTDEAQKYLFFLIIEPIDSQHLELQTKCLRVLTRRGSRIAPFALELVQYINGNLKEQYEALFEARRRNRSYSDRNDGRHQHPEERGLYSLLSLTTEVVSKNSGAFEGHDQEVLLDHILFIAEKTTARKDMTRAVAVLGVIIRSSVIPEKYLQPSIEILCAISNAVKELRDEIKESLIFALRSDQRSNVIKVLLNTLSLAPNDRHTHTVCGALSLVVFLVKNRGEYDLPLISFGQFIESFWRVHFGSRRIRRDCLEMISGLLDYPDIKNDILSSDWNHMIDTVLTATGDDIYSPNQQQPLTIRRDRNSHNSRGTPDSESSGDRRIADEIFGYLKRIATSFNYLWLHLNLEQKTLVSRFYHELRAVLPPEILDQLILRVTTMANMPEAAAHNPAYYDAIFEFMDLFILHKRIPPLPYGRIMQGIRDDLQTAVGNNDEVKITKITEAAHVFLEEFYTVQGGGWQKAVELADLLSLCWIIRLPEQFENYLELMKPLLSARADDEDLEVSQESDSNSLYSAQLGLSRVTLSIVRVFLHYLPSCGTSSSLLFNSLVEIAQNRELLPSVRLPALRLLARLRSDQNNAIFVAKSADSLSLASALRRTEAAVRQLATFQEEMVQHRPVSRTNRMSTESRELRRVRGSIISRDKPAVKPPLWMYPGGPGLPTEPPSRPSQSVFLHTKGNQESNTLRLGNWLLSILEILQNEHEWEVYSYVVVHLPSQLCNPSLFSYSIPALKVLRNVLVSQLQNGKFQEPPIETHVKKGDVALCLMHSLSILLGYSEHFSRAEQDEMVKTFLFGISGWDRTAQICIQALATACHVIPASITKALPAILQKMSQIITQANLTMDILEFLGGLARLPNIYINLREEEFRTVFAICVRYLEHSREQRLKLALGGAMSKDYSSSRESNAASPNLIMEPREPSNPHKDLPQYVFVLVYHVITIWFLSLKLADRYKHVGWISKNLAWTDESGVERMEEQSQVTLDMMLRTTYSDLPESKPTVSFSSTDGLVLKKSWLVGLSVVTVETAVNTGLTHVTKRQISGTTYLKCYQQIPEPPPHQVAMPTDTSSTLHGPESRINVFPNHLLLQLTTSIAPTPMPLEPVALPEENAVRRALETLDRSDTLDGYRIGVIFIGNGQTKEGEILANTHGSKAFDRFVEGLGTKVQLKGAIFNTQGLDRSSDTDGTHTYAWRDRIVEIVYHIPTMMPTNLEDDPQCTNKKRHIGNNFVNIIWNESGLPYKFDTFPSQFNSVNILITPENKLVATEAESKTDGTSITTENEDNENPSDSFRCLIQTLTKSSMPRISPAAVMKLLPLDNLPALARQLALNSAIFSNVWEHRQDGEYVSSWRNRLRQIVQLRERWAGRERSTEEKFAGARGTKTYGPGDLFKGRVEMGGLTEEEGILGTLDFSRWGGAPPSLSEMPNPP